MKPVHEKINYPLNQSMRVFEFSHSYFTAPFHVHPELELVHITHGYGKRFVGDSVEDFAPGDTVFIGGGVPHFWKSDPAFYQKNDLKASEAIVLQFSPDLILGNQLNKSEFQNIASALRLANLGVSLTGNTNILILEKLKKMLQSDGLSNVLALFKILDKIGNHEDARVLNKPSYNENYIRNKSARFKTLYNFLANNYNKDISLEETASVVNMNKTAFCRYFKRETDQTFIAYLNEMRINFACKLLVDKSLSISQICFEVGFNNLSNFNRQFKSVTGKTPSEYTNDFVL